jgi:hypothetical protein
MNIHSRIRLHDYMGSLQIYLCIPCNNLNKLCVNVNRLHLLLFKQKVYILYRFI